MSDFELTAKRLASALAVVAVWTLAAPPEASAEVSHDALWGEAPESCLGRTDMNDHGLAPLMSRRPADTGTSERVTTCLKDSETAEHSHQVCLENVDVPASVVPALVAEVRAFDRSENVLAAAHRLADGNGTDAEEPPSIPNRAAAPKSLPLAEIPTPPNRPDPTASCTASNPEECRSLPPRSTLNIESSPTPPRVRSAQLTWNDDVEPADREVPSAGTRVGPADGHDSPPDKPPQPTPGMGS